MCSPDTTDVHVEQGLDKAMESYRRYLEETPKTAMTPEAMRRLADLKVEKQFGILGDGKLLEMEAPEAAPERMELAASSSERSEGSRHRGPIGIAEGFRASRDRADEARTERPRIRGNRAWQHR